MLFSLDETILITLKKTITNAIGIKYDSINFILLGEPFFGRKKDSG
tara:strand:- start:532 stop:669 length:138 start_codon:yes stop_codon:yes gene_type:complete